MPLIEDDRMEISMKYYVYLSKNKINMLYDQLETEEYEEENTIGFDFKIVKGETKTKSNTRDNIYQKVKCVSSALRNECGNIEQDFPYIQCKMKLNCYYYDYYVKKFNMVYWGGIQLINDILYVLYMTGSMDNMLFVKKEDSEGNEYNFASSYSGLLKFMSSYNNGKIYCTDEFPRVLDDVTNVIFLSIAASLNIEGKNKFLEYDFMAKIFRKEFIYFDKLKEAGFYVDQIKDLFKGYNFDKICAVYASPLYISLL